MKRKNQAPCGDVMHRARLQEIADKFERENWSLPPEQRHAAHRLSTTATDLMLAITRLGGMEVGAIGQELASLARMGFIEIRTGTNGTRRASAHITFAGALALLLRAAVRTAANTPKGKANGHDDDEGDDTEARTAA